jgi:hypothetical protein
MRKFAEVLLALTVGLATVVAASAVPTLDERRSEAQSENLCENWRRGCARLHGNRTRNWRACMKQPQAIDDCSGGVRPADVCENWRSDCARMHGLRTRAYVRCMRQPQALADCGR